MSVILRNTYNFGIFLSINAFKFGSINFFASLLFGDKLSPSLSGACKQFWSLNFFTNFLPVPAAESDSGSADFSGISEKFFSAYSLALAFFFSKAYYFSISALSFSSFLALISANILSYCSLIFLARSFLILASSRSFYSYSSSKAAASSGFKTI